MLWHQTVLETVLLRALLCPLVSVYMNNMFECIVHMEQCTCVHGPNQVLFGATQGSCRNTGLWDPTPSSVECKGEIITVHNVHT